MACLVRCGGGPKPREAGRGSPAATRACGAGCAALRAPAPDTHPTGYNPISDYALIGDTHSTALIDRQGSVDWLCWPRHDSPALFLRLLDARKGGACRIELDGPEGSSRAYLAETNILQTRFSTTSGEVRLTDLMPVKPPETLAGEGPDGENESRLIRLVECLHGTVSGRFRVRPTFNYAREEARLRQDQDGDVMFEGAAQRLRAHASHGLRIEDGAAVAEWRLAAGEQSCLVLSHDDGATPFEGIRDAVARLEQTRRYWQQWSSVCTYRGRYRAQVLRSALCLKLLTYSPTGAIIAAPTLGLPEAVPGNRNYDYRFSWLRDASFTVSSFVMLGYEREAAEYLRFLRHADPTRGRELRLIYGIDGPQPDPETLGHLEGWRGTGPVSIGNEARNQSQFDIFGEVLASLHGYLEHVGYDPPQKVHDHLPESVGNLVENVLRSRNQPDQGIWELRGPPRQILHSKGMHRVALECAVSIASRSGRIDPGTIARWRRHADEITADYLDQGWNEARRAYTMDYGGDALDCAVLRLVLFGAIDAHDPRLASTLERIEAELGIGDLLRRYRIDDGMEGEEATFSACSFWRVGVLALMGRMEQASALYERLLTRGNDLGLFAEEIDAATGEQRGNFPQGFTHMALINCALLMEAVRDGSDRAP